MTSEQLHVDPQAARDRSVGEPSLPLLDHWRDIGRRLEVKRQQHLADLEGVQTPSLVEVAKTIAATNVSDIDKRMYARTLTNDQRVKLLLQIQDLSEGLDIKKIQDEAQLGHISELSFSDFSARLLAEVVASTESRDAAVALLQKYDLPEIIGYTALEHAVGDFFLIEEGVDSHFSAHKYTDHCLAAARPYMRDEEIQKVFDTDKAAVLLRAKASEKGRLDTQSTASIANWLMTAGMFNPHAQESYYQAIIPPDYQPSAEEMIAMLDWHELGYESDLLRCGYFENSGARTLITRLATPIASRFRGLDALGWTQDLDFFLSHVDRLANQPQQKGSDVVVPKDVMVKLVNRLSSVGSYPPHEQRFKVIDLAIKTGVLKEEQGRIKITSTKNLKEAEMLDRLITHWTELRQCGYVKDSARQTEREHDYLDIHALTEYRKEVERHKLLAREMQARLEQTDLAGKIGLEVERIAAQGQLPSSDNIMGVLRSARELPHTQRRRPPMDFYYFNPFQPQPENFIETFGVDMVGVRVIQDGSFNAADLETIGLTKLSPEKSSQIGQRLLDATQMGEVPWTQLYTLASIVETYQNRLPDMVNQHGISDQGERRDFVLAQVSHVCEFLEHATYIPDEYRQPLLSYYQTIRDRVDTIIDFTDKRVVTKTEGLAILQASLVSATESAKRETDWRWHVKGRVNLLARMAAAASITHYDPGEQAYRFNDPISPTLVRSVLNDEGILASGKFRARWRKPNDRIVRGDPYTRAPVGNITITRGGLIVVMAPSGAGKSTLLDALVNGVNAGATSGIAVARHIEMPLGEDGTTPSAKELPEAKTTYEGSLFQNGAKNAASLVWRILGEHGSGEDVMLVLDEALKGTDSRKKSFMGVALSMVLKEIYPHLTPVIVDHNGARVFRTLHALGMVEDPDELLPANVQTLTVNPESHLPRGGLAEGMGLLTAQRVGIDEKVLARAALIDEALRSSATEIDFSNFEAERPFQKEIGPDEPVLIVDPLSLKALDFDPTMRQTGVFDAVRSHVMVNLTQANQNQAHFVTRIYAQALLDSFNVSNQEQVAKRIGVADKFAALLAKRPAQAKEFAQSLTGSAQRVYQLVSPSSLQDLLEVESSLLRRNIGGQDEVFSRIQQLLPYAGFVGLEKSPTLEASIIKLGSMGKEIAESVRKEIYKAARRTVVAQLFELDSPNGITEESILKALEEGKERTMHDVRLATRENRLVLESTLDLPEEILNHPIMNLLKSKVPQDGVSLKKWISEMEAMFSQTKSPTAIKLNDLISDEITHSWNIARLGGEELSAQLADIDLFLKDMTYGVVTASMLAKGEFKKVGDALADELFPVSLQDTSDLGMKDYLSVRSKDYHPQSLQLPEDWADAKVIILNGPNGSGKTEIAKLIGQAVLLGKGTGLACGDVQIGRCDSLIVSINPEKEFKTDSTFTSVARRMKRIIQQAKEYIEKGRSPLIIIDEPYEGIGSDDRTNLIASTLDYLVQMGAKVVITNHELGVMTHLDRINATAATKQGETSGKLRIKYVPVAMDRKTYQVALDGYGKTTSSDPEDILLEEFAAMADRYSMPELTEIAARTVELTHALMEFDQQMENRIQAANQW